MSLRCERFIIENPLRCVHFIIENPLRCEHFIIKNPLRCRGLTFVALNVFDSRFQFMLIITIPFVVTFRPYSAGKSVFS